MNILSKATISVIAATTAVNIFGLPAKGFTITQNSNGSDLFNALSGDTSGLSDFSITTTGNSEGFGIFNDDPFGLGTGVVLSTGLVEELPGENTLDDEFLNGSDLSTDLGEEGEADDSITLNISFFADNTAEKLFFTYVFGSEEFLEFSGDIFNDSFSLKLNGTNLALLNDGQTVTVNSLTPNPVPPFNTNFINNPAGSGTTTKLDGFTIPLTFEGSLIQDANNILSINILDASDAILDSAVFIKGLETRANNPHKVPEPISIFSLLAMVMFGVVSLKSKHN